MVSSIKGIMYVHICMRYNNKTNSAVFERKECVKARRISSLSFFSHFPHSLLLPDYLYLCIGSRVFSALSELPEALYQEQCAVIATMEYNTGL